MNINRKLELIQRMSYLQNRLAGDYLTSIERSACNEELKKTLMSLSDMLFSEMDGAKKVVTTIQASVYAGETKELQTNMDDELDESCEFVQSYFGYNPFLVFETRMTDKGIRLFVHNNAAKQDDIYDIATITFNERLGYVTKRKKEMVRE